MIIGASAASRVGAKHLNERLLNEQIDVFTKNGEVPLTKDQMAQLEDFVEGKADFIEIVGSKKAGINITKDELQELSSQIKEGVLDRHGLEILQELDGLSELNNPKLVQLIEENIQKRPSLGLSSNDSTPLPTQDDLSGSCNALSKESKQLATPKKTVTPKNPEKSGYTGVQPKRPAISQSQTLKTSTPSHLEDNPAPLLRRDLKEIHANIRELQEGLNKAKNPEIIAKLQKGIALQNLKKEALLNSSDQAAEELLERIGTLADKDFAFIPAQNAQEGFSIALRNGSEIQILQGDAAQEFLSSGGADLPINDILQRFDLSSEFGKSRLLASLQESLGGFQSERVAKAIEEKAQGNLSSLAGSKVDSSSVLLSELERNYFLLEMDQIMQEVNQSKAELAYFDNFIKQELSRQKSGGLVW